MIVIVAVDAVQHHIAVIDVKQPVANLNIAKAHALRHHFKSIAVSVFQGHHQVVEIRRLRGPLVRSANANSKVGADALVNGQCVDGACMYNILTVKQRILQRSDCRVGGQVFQNQLAGEGGIAIIVVKIGANGEVLNVDGVFTNQINVAEDARRPPHILVFNIGGICPLHHADA